MVSVRQSNSSTQQFIWIETVSFFFLYCVVYSIGVFLHFMYIHRLKRVQIVVHTQTHASCVHCLHSRAEPSLYCLYHRSRVFNTNKSKTIHAHTSIALHGRCYSTTHTYFYLVFVGTSFKQYTELTWSECLMFAFKFAKETRRTIDQCSSNEKKYFILLNYQLETVAQSTQQPC